jgi:NHLM bacteriocin system ABC transporter peptidase/ATP-binding protein
MTGAARVKTPDILQFEATECGAVALAIVLGYFGCHVSLSELRRRCGVSRDGSKAINMLRTARSLGMDAQGVMASSIQALTGLPLPIIVFWQFDHFVVVEGFDEDSVYVNDPEFGHRRLSNREFDSGFTGVALTIMPGDAFVPQGRKPSAWHALRDRLAGSWNGVAFVVAATAALAIPALVIAGLSKVFIDHVLVANIGGWLWPLVIAILTATLLAISISWLQMSCMMRLRLKFSMVTGAEFLWQTLHLPLAYFEQRYAGDIGERLDANERIAGFLTDQVAEGVVGLLTMALFATALFALSPTLAAIAVGTTAFNAALFVLLAGPIKRRAQRHRQDSARLAAVQVGGLQAIETLRATGMEGELLNRRAAAHASELTSQRELEDVSRVLELVPEFIVGASAVAILGVGAIEIMSGDITIGTLVAFEAIALSFQQPVTFMLELAGDLQMQRADLERLDDTLGQRWDSFYSFSRDGASDLSNRLAASRVAFSYSPFDEPVVRDMDIALAEGCSVAMVGRTGSGKTTMARLLCGLLEPVSGHVVHETTAGNQTGGVALVDQDCRLFEGSVRENLTLWDDLVPDDTLKRCLAEACIDSVVMARGGLDARIAEGGANFSGGECQRLEIARALVHSPRLLILDEATGALDVLVEKRVLRNIRARRCGVLIITHRLSAVRDCDEIVVIDKGHIVMRGTHDWLAQRSADYRTLLSWESELDA